MLYWFLQELFIILFFYSYRPQVRCTGRENGKGHLTVIFSFSSVLVLTFKCLSCCSNLEQLVMIPMGSCNSCITSFSPKQDGRDNNGNHLCQLYTRIFFALAIVEPCLDSLHFSSPPGNLVSESCEP